MQRHTIQTRRYTLAGYLLLGIGKDFQRQCSFFTLPNQHDIQFIANKHDRCLTLKICNAGDFLVAHLHDYIARSQSRFLCRTGRLHVNYYHSGRRAVGGQYVKCFCKLAVQGLHNRAHVTPIHFAVFNQFINNRRSHICGYRKPNANIAAVGRVNRRVDANQVTAQIHQRAARITRVNGRVGLNKIFVAFDTQATTTEGANNTAGYSLVKTKRVPNGHHEIAYAQC